jgi:hypothetical protein
VSELNLHLSAPRKVAEVWVLPARGEQWDVQMRVIVGNWPEALASGVASEAVAELARGTTSGTTEYARDDRLEPRGSAERKYRLQFTEAEHARFETVAAAHGIELSDLVRQAMQLAVRAHRGELCDCRAARQVVIRGA